jgi:hypothetical protein
MRLVRVFAVAALQLLFLIFFPGASLAQESSGGGFDFQTMRRVNVHGDEYNSVAASTDGNHLVIGTEKGLVVVWNVAEGRVEKNLSQGSPIHEVVSLGDGRRFVAAGGWHSGAAHSSVVREWDIESGTSREWPGVGEETFTLLASDPAAGLVAGATGGLVAGAPGSHVVVWSARDGRVVASWEFRQTALGLAVSGQSVYLTLADAESLLSGDEEQLKPNSILVLDAREPKRAASTRRSSRREYGAGT